MFQLDEKLGYFKNQGVDVMAFDDIYPSGHQSGVSIIMHEKRIATNGDLRFEPTPGQWQPTPVQPTTLKDAMMQPQLSKTAPKDADRIVDAENNVITATLRYPDQEMNLRGFNPLLYPDYDLEYKVMVKGEGDSVHVTVDLDKPIPEKMKGKLMFNLELFPGELFGKYWMMDDKQGIFPRQANGPTMKRESVYSVCDLHKPMEGSLGDKNHLAGNNPFNNGKECGKSVLETAEGSCEKGAFAKALEGDCYQPILADDLVSEPYAQGQCFTLCPEEPSLKMTILSRKEPLKLYDGRFNHNNGWFVLSCEVPVGEQEKVIDLMVSPNVIPNYKREPVIQISQVGYHCEQRKRAVLELDRRDEKTGKVQLYRITAMGEQLVLTKEAAEWGDFLRYHYVTFDFSEVKEEGLYKIKFRNSQSNVFRIASDIYDRGVWQPVLEYFLPVQMCHMRVNEKYKVWHDLCHDDDAFMAPTNLQHFDGYFQGASTLTKYAPGDRVPGLNAGGWHDAGDFDLRVESQADEAYNLALAWESFGTYYDATTIDQKKKVVEIHQPDGSNDFQEQIEHGLLTVVGGYEALGRLYRGIITGDLRGYVLLGDPAAMTSGDPEKKDGRWVFTEENPMRELSVAAALACASKAMRGFRDQLAERTLKVAEELYQITHAEERVLPNKLHAAVELFLATGKEEYKEFILTNQKIFFEQLQRMGWMACRCVKALENAEFAESLREAVKQHVEKIAEMGAETPYGIPYKPLIWGAGWQIQGMGAKSYFIYKAFPDIFPKEMIFDCLHFVLGCHPGSNTASFASGVGVKSATVAYGMNRADWSYIPGGVISGTALIRPDFPELLEFPYLWQQGEYVLGGGSSNYLFLVLACQSILKDM